MFLGALIIGLLTAYYFGIKPGLTAAAGAVLLFFLAALLPDTAVIIYSVVAVFITGVCWAGPRRESPDNDARNALRRWTRRAARDLWRRL